MEEVKRSKSHMSDYYNYEGLGPEIQKSRKTSLHFRGQNSALASPKMIAVPSETGLNNTLGQTFITDKIGT